MPDTIPPVTTHDYDLTLKNADFTITLTATDAGGSGLFDTFYRINFGSVKRVSLDGQPLISTEGLNNILEFWSRDNDGNTESLQVLSLIKLDKTPPHILTDMSGLNGTTVQSDQNREITIDMTDNIALANSVTLFYVRTGVDMAPQSIPLNLQVAGPSGTYKGFLNENPDRCEYNVTSIDYWIEGTDLAGNPIAIGGSQVSPLAHYYVDDMTPIFGPTYVPNIRIGQTETVRNLGYASSYVNQQIVALEICLNNSSFTVSANFAALDSNYVPGHEIVFNIGSGIYHIFYEISSSNTTIAANVPVIITATDGGSNTTIDVSFRASVITGLALMDVLPGHNATGLSIDTGIVLQFNDEISDDGLTTGHVYMTDEHGEGIPIDIDIINNTLILCPVYRLSPKTTYTVHANPDLPADILPLMGHFNEAVFTTGPFFPPLVPPGYSVTNAAGDPLSISDNSLKLFNGKSMTLTWPVLDIDIINGGDLRTFPIMVSDSNSALMWVDNPNTDYTHPTVNPILEIEDLDELDSPRIRLSNDDIIIFQGGWLSTTNPVVAASIFAGDKLTLTLKSIGSIFVDEAETITMVADAQNCLVRLSWCIPDSIYYQSLRLVRKDGSFPSGPNDGTVLFDGNRTVWYDINRPNGTEQFYRLFVNECSTFYYDFIIQASATPSPVTKIVYEYGEYETGLMKQLESFGLACACSLLACDNAVRDKANNGNERDSDRPIFYEYILGTNPCDDTNQIVKKDGNSVVVELDPTLSFELKEIENMFILFDKAAAKDQACNTSVMTMFLDIKGPASTGTLIHLKPLQP